MEKYQERTFANKERQDRKDANGIMHAVSIGTTPSGAYLTAYYGSGKVTHFIPAKVLPHLKLALERIDRKGAN